MPSTDFSYPTPPDGPVPEFHSIEEETEYWDTHDTTDFTLLTPLDFLDDDELARVLPVLLEPNDREELDRRAEELGVEPVKLAQMWIEERLKTEKAPRKGSGSSP